MKKVAAVSMAILATTAGMASESGTPRRAGPKAGGGMTVIADVPTNGWLGKWRGPDGRTLSIAADGGAYSGRYHVTLVAGGKARHFTGLAYLDTIVFDRDGRKESIRSVAGKTPCLAIGPRERYCRV